jgi:type I restriction enzyme R subunit
VDKSFWWKTSELVQQYTTTTTLGPIRKFTDLGPEALERLAQEDVPDTVKVFNLIKALVDLVAEKGAMAAYLIPIGERADQIAEAFRERQLTTQQALQQLEQLVREYRTAEETRQQSDLSAEGFAALLLLQRSQVQGAEQLAQTIAEAFTRSPYWKQGGDQERALRRAVYKTLVDGDYPVEQMAVFTDQLLRTVRRAGPVA